MKRKWAEITFFAAAILASPLEAAQQTNATFEALKAGSTTYFTTKIDNLTQKLQLSPDQQTKIRPIAEQEVGYLEQIRANPALSRKHKLKRLKTIVSKSDGRMKPVLFRSSGRNFTL